MRIKKLISLLLAFIFIVTSTANCFSMFGPDIQPLDPIPPGIEDQLEQYRQRIQELLEKVKKSDAEIVKLREIYAKNKAELDELNERYCRAIADCDDYKLRLDMQREISRAGEEDILCTDCICCHNPIDEAATLISGDVSLRPASCITFRSKRFYKGMAIGAVIVAVILVGVYVYVYYIHVPAGSE